MSGDVALVSALERVAGALERLASSLEGSKPAGNRMGAIPPTPASSKAPSLSIVTIREHLAKWSSDLEITTDLDGCFTVKPRKYLHQSWAEINQVIRSLGGKWQSNGKEGSWRIAKC